MMKRLLVAAAAALCFCQVSRAQDEISNTKTINQNAAADFARTSASGDVLLQTSHSSMQAQFSNQVAGSSLASGEKLSTSSFGDQFRWLTLAAFTLSARLQNGVWLLCCLCPPSHTLAFSRPRSGKVASEFPHSN